MNNRLISYLTILVLVCLAALLILNVTQLFNQPPNEKFLSYNDVKGIAVEHKGLLYTLNFEQQTSLIDLINRSVQISKKMEGVDQSQLDFSKIIVYRFDKPDLVITPVGYVANKLVYFMPDWHAEGYLNDASPGNMKKLIQQTYDH